MGGVPVVWPASIAVAVGTTGAFENLSIDPAQKRIGVALLDEGSTWSVATWLLNEVFSHAAP